MVAESFIGIYGFGTGEVVTEGAPLPRPDPNTGVGAGRAAMRSLEEQVLGAEGIEGTRRIDALQERADVKGYPHGPADDC
jgi:hypothetical protein